MRLTETKLRKIVRGMLSELGFTPGGYKLGKFGGKPVEGKPLPRDPSKPGFKTKMTPGPKVGAPDIDPDLDDEDLDDEDPEGYWDGPRDDPDDLPW